MCALLTKNEVKMDIGQVLLCVCEVNKKSKKQRGQYPAIMTKRADCNMAKKRTLFCGTKVGNPERVN